MPVAYVGAGTRAAFGGGSAANPSKTGFTAGNLAVLSVAISRGDTAATALAAPSGWSVALNPAGPTIAGSPNYTPVVAVFYKLSSAGGTESATVSGPGGSYGWAQIEEFSGGPFTFSGVMTAQGIFNTLANARSVGPTGANTIANAVAIFVGHPEDTIGNITALGTPSGFTNINLEAANNAEIAWSNAYQLLTNTGTRTGNYAWTTNGYFAGVGVIFEGPSTGTTLSPTGIASGEAWGSPSVRLSVSPTGLASAEAWGSPSARLGVTPGGIASGEAWGSPSVSQGAATLTPTGIPSGEAWGTPSVGLTVAPTGLASAEAWGSPTVTPVAGLQPAGIPSGEAWGTPAVALQLSPAGIASGEAWGGGLAYLGLAPGGIPSGEAWGSPSVSQGAATLTPTGIASGEAWGTPTVTANPILTPTGIPSAEAWGTPAVGLGLAPAGIGTAEAWGAPVAALQLSPGGVGSGEAWGTPTVTPVAGLQPEGIPSAEAWGVPSLRLGLTPAGIASGEAWGVPSVFTTLTLTPTGIPSAEAWGVPFVGAVVITGPTRWIYTMIQPERRVSTILAESRGSIIRPENRTTEVPAHA